MITMLVADAAGVAMIMGYDHGRDAGVFAGVPGLLVPARSPHYID